MTEIPLGVHLGERLTLEQTWWQAEFADTHGFESVWVAEGRLARDGIVPAAVIASRTQRVGVATGVVNNKSRNAALMAVTFKTIDEIAPGRAILGIGAWWEPIASKVGTPVERPVTAMREYVGVLQAFFRNELVEFSGDFVHMDGVRFDSMYHENKAIDVPIYFGSVGPKMLQLAGEISDGVNLDFLLPVSYLEGALAAIGKGIAKRTDGRERIHVTQIIACSVDDDDPDEAVDACRAFLTQYLMQQPHIAEHCGVEPELVERIKEVAGWPATPDDVRRAMRLVPTSLVHEVTACGRSGQAYDKLCEFHEAGVELPIISTHGDKEQTLLALAAAAGRG
ncbi:MAG: 5,10-methylenetetrahydromethanopterin reductase [Acidimicrobiales bacterium]|nr:MAG: 5,10-methylenetetrahydromethanopterin reductase [Acidimicrobiales bacterium]